mmetsp:Transcript_42442/g.122745  ORF Transcript_42442/g.122745 Transcript_42442/m.122745 type:complete len:427 (-) Transcript_42442:879-2159(-)
MSLLNLLVHDCLNLHKLVVLDWLVVREIKAQLALIHQRTLLVHLLTKHLPQRKVQDVRGSVVLGNQRPPHVVHFDRDGVSDLDRAALHAADVQDVAGVLLRVIALELSARARGDRGRVEDLAALLSIARCPIEHNAHSLRGRVARVNELLAVIDGHDLRRLLRAISLGVPLVFQRLVGRRHGHRLGQGIRLRSLQLHVLAILEGPALLGILFELGHLDIEAIHVHCHLGFLAHQLREINREAIAGEKQESILCSDLPLLRPGGKLTNALVEGPAKLLLLFLDDGLHIIHVLPERWEGIAQRIDDAVDERVEEAGLGLEDIASKSHSSPQDPAKHVPTTVIRRNCSICEGNRQCSDVVRNDAVRHVNEVLVILANLAAVGPGTRLLLNCSEDACKDVGVVVAPLVHQHRCHPLKAHSSVDTLGRQLC